MAKIKLVEKATPRWEAFAPKTVKIGDQTWMAENLSIDDGEEGIYFNEKTGERYYTWEAASRIAKSIPGWHLPTAEEWVKAAEVCGATPGSDGDYTGVEKLKSKLNIKLAGTWLRGFFLTAGTYAYFWTASEYSSTNAYGCYFSSGASMYSDFDNKTYYAYSVRLVKD